MDLDRFVDKYRQLRVVEAARFLVGHCLVRDHPELGEVRALITEAEAYREDDPASHSYHGRTARTWPMFERPGILYVYLSYGVHHCMNVSAEEEGRGAAVLIRRLVGLPPHQHLRMLGPGLICRALAIDRSMNGLDLFDPASPLRLMPNPEREKLAPYIQVGERIGIKVAVEKPWRFYINRELEKALLTGGRQADLSLLESARGQAGEAQGQGSQSGA